MRCIRVAVAALFLAGTATTAVAQQEQYSPSATLFDGSVHYVIRNAAGQMCVQHFGGTTPIDSLPCISLDGMKSGIGIAIAGETPGAPATSLLHAFAVADNGNMFHTQYLSWGWGGWQNLYGVFTSKPAAAYYKGKLYVFGRGQDGRIWWAAGNGDEFSPWVQLGTSSVESAPSVAAGPDGLQIVARVSGTNVSAIAFDGRTGGSWTPLGSGAAGDPAIIWSGGNSFEVFVRGTDNGIYGLGYRTTGQRTQFGKVPGGTQASPALVRDSSGSATVFVYGTDGANYLATRSASSSWSAFRNVYTLDAKKVGGTGYPNISIKNYAPFGLQVWVHYTLRSCATKWMHVSAAKTDTAGVVTPGVLDPGNGTGRNACLISQVTAEADRGAPSDLTIQSYYSTGTSYRTYFFLPQPPEQELGAAAGKNWVMYSSNEASDPAQGTTGKSPGFVVTNKTKWPVAVSFDQAGCLYHDVIRPGKSMNRTTGAVWFTINATIVPDGVDPNTDLKCAIPVVEIVADVLEAAMTAGVVGWAGLTAAAVEESVGPLAAKLIPETIFKSATTAAAKAVISNQMGVLMKSLSPNQTASIAGQYAGPPWPFRCDQKPTYEVKEGWGNTGSKDGSFWIDPGSPLQIVKTNNCGNNLNNNARK